MMFAHRQPQRLGLISLFSFSRSRTARSCSTSSQLVFVFSPHPILFRPITESLGLASVPCSLNPRPRTPTSQARSSPGAARRSLFPWRIYHTKAGRFAL
jgi:hypothetical protein